MPLPQKLNPNETVSLYEDNAGGLYLVYDDQAWANPTGPFIDDAFAIVHGETESWTLDTWNGRQDTFIVVSIQTLDLIAQSDGQAVVYIKKGGLSAQKYLSAPYGDAPHTPEANAALFPISTTVYRETRYPLNGDIKVQMATEEGFLTSWLHRMSDKEIINWLVAERTSAVYVVAQTLEYPFAHYEWSETIDPTRDLQLEVFGKPSTPRRFVEAQMVFTQKMKLI